MHEPHNIETSVNILNVSLGTQNNSVLAQVGDVQNEDVEDYQVQWMQHSGFCSLPPNAVPNGKAAEGVMITETNRSVIFASRDVSSQNNYGNLNPGESCIYAAGPNGTGQARVMCKGDGSITLYTTDDNTPTGKGISLTLSPTGLSFQSPFITATWDATGHHVFNNTGARIDLFSTSVPGPLSAVMGSGVSITGSSFSANCGSVMLGPSAGISLPALYGVLPVVAPGIPIMGQGVGDVIVDASASTCVFISTGISA